MRDDQEAVSSLRSGRVVRILPGRLRRKLISVGNDEVVDQIHHSILFRATLEFFIQALEFRIHHWLRQVRCVRLFQKLLGAINDCGEVGQSNSPQCCGILAPCPTFWHQILVSAKPGIGQRGGEKVQYQDNSLRVIELSFLPEPHYRGRHVIDKEIPSVIAVHLQK
jgi:hypothetical protein